MTGEIIGERYFRKGGIVPEWGIRYGKKLLLFEFSTADNFRRQYLILGKIERYRQYYPEAEILFVFDVEREMVMDFVETVKKMTDTRRFFFVDYATFKSVKIGQQLTAPVYFWGGDAGVHPLRYEPS